MQAVSLAASLAVVGVSVSIGVSIADNRVDNDVSALVSGTVLSISGGASAVILRAFTGLAVPSFALSGSLAASLTDAATADLTSNGSALETSDKTSDAAMLAALKLALQTAGETVSGTLRVAVVRAGEKWSVVDTSGRQWSIELISGSLLATRSTITATASASSVAAAGGLVGVALSGAGASAVNAVTSNTSAKISGAQLLAAGSITVQAVNSAAINASVLATSMAAGLGLAGVGVSIGAAISRNYIGYDMRANRVAGRGLTSAIVENTTSASTGLGALTVTAASSQAITANVFAGSMAVAGGIVGLARSGSGVEALNLIASDSLAAIRGSATGLTLASVSLSATNLSSIDANAGAVAMSLAGGGLSLSGSVAVTLAENRISSSTTAEISRNAASGAFGSVTTQSGGISVSARDEAEIRSVASAAALAASVGIIGVAISGAGAASENTIHTATTVLADHMTLYAAADIDFTAESSATILSTVISAAVSLGGGVVGAATSIGASLAKNTIGSTAQDGVFALSNGAVLTAAGDVSFAASMSSRIEATVASIAVALAEGLSANSAAGSGAAVDNTIGYSVSALVTGGSITASAGAVLISATDTATLISHVAAGSVAASYGIGNSMALAISLASATLQNAVIARIDGASVLADSVTVQALETMTVDVTSSAAAVSAAYGGMALSGGGASAVMTNSSTILAEIIGAAANIQALSGVTVTATALQSLKTRVDALSIAAGFIAIAGGGGTALVTSNGVITARVFDADITAAALLVAAYDGISQSAVVEGMTVGTTAGIGASVATVTTAQRVTGSVGGASARLVLGSLTVTAEEAGLNGADLANVETYASGGGILLGVQSTVSLASNASTVSATVAEGGAVISLTGAAKFAATSIANQRVVANAAAGGLIGIGAAVANAVSTSVTSALIGQSTHITGTDLAIFAVSTDHTDGYVNAGAYGLAAGAAAVVNSTIHANVLAGIADAANATNASTLNLSGVFSVSAGHVADPVATIATSAGGALAGAGAAITHIIYAAVDVIIGDWTNLTAGSILIDVGNTLTGSGRIDGKAGGIAAATKSDIYTAIDFSTNVRFGTSSIVHTTDTTGILRATVFTKITYTENAKLVTHGALAGSGADVEFNGKALSASIVVGSNAQLTSEGEIELEVNGLYTVTLQSSTETLGGVTVAIGAGTIDVTPNYKIEFSSGSYSRATGDFYASVGTNRELEYNINMFDVHVDNFAGSTPIPVSDLKTHVLYQAYNLIKIDANATTESYANIYLHADGFSIASVVGVAKTTSWVAALSGGSIGSGAGATRAVIEGSVINDGLIKTGAKRNKALTLISVVAPVVDSLGQAVYIVDDAGNPVLDENGLKQQMLSVQTIADPNKPPSDISFTDSTGTLQTSQFDAIALAQQKINDYPNDAQVVAFYSTQIARIKQDLLKLGLAELIDSEIVPIIPEVETVTFAPISAQAGQVKIFSDQLSGTGTFDVPKNASIVINSKSSANLTFNGIYIPNTNGGIYFNGTDITDVTGTATTVADGLDWIQGENLRKVNLNNDTTTNIGTKDSVLSARFNITANSVDHAAATPTILIDVVNINELIDQTTGVIPPPQSVLVQGDINARTSSVTINNHSQGGSITLKAAVNAAVISIHADASVNISGVMIQQVGGDPYAAFLTGALTGSEGINQASSAGLAAYYATPASTTPSISAKRVVIEAEFIDVNGLIQSGQNSYTLELNADEYSQIIRAQKSGNNFTNIKLTTSAKDANGKLIANDDFTVVYDRVRNILITKAVNPYGGYIELTGAIMNTQNGQITAYAGYPQITVTNNMSAIAGMTIQIDGIDADTVGDGKIILHDKTKSETTTYTKQISGNVLKQVTTFVDVPVSTYTYTGGAVNSVQYSPMANFRYGWSIAVKTQTTDISKFSKSGWLFINLGTSPVLNVTDSMQLSAKLVEGSQYFYKDANALAGYSYQASSNPGVNYTYSSSTVTTSDSGWLSQGYSVSKTWYGKKTYHYKYERTSGTTTTYQQSILADRPIGINFLFNATGNISVNAGAANILIAGNLNNQTGTTSLVTTGSITTSATEAAGQSAAVGGKIITLTAGGAIGAQSAPLQVKLASTLPGAVLNATAPGAINLAAVAGDLIVGTISTVRNVAYGGSTLQSRESINITAKKSIIATSSSLIAGSSIVLDAQGGGIGSALIPLRIDTGAQPTDTLTVTAAGTVALREISGDLSIFSISSPGKDVVLIVDSGSVLDGNNIQVVDTRTTDQLLATVWTDLQLTADTGANTKVQDTLDSLSAARTREYQTYWKWRSLQGEPHFADILSNASAVMVTSDEEIASLRASYLPAGVTWVTASVDEKAAVDLQIQTLMLSRTEQLRSLNATYGSLTAAYDSSYSVALTAAEIAQVTGSIKIWTADELLFGFSAGLLKPVTSTQTSIEDANITAGTLKITASGGVGYAGSKTLIDFTGTMTNDERILLAAAESKDVTFLLTNVIAATVDFNLTTSTMHRTDGGSWSSTFAVGDYIEVIGLTLNATGNGNFYRIGSISNGGADIIIETGAGLLSLSADERLQSVSVAAVAMDPMSQIGAVKWLEILKREDLNVTLDSTLAITANGNAFVGSRSNMHLLDINVAGTAIIKSAGSLYGHSGSSTLANIVAGGDLVLEAGYGSIGTGVDANRLWINLTSANAQLTARAQNDIWIGETLGDMRVATIYSSTGNVDLLAVAGNIVDAINSDFVNIQAYNIQLQASGSIGSQSNDLDIQAVYDGGTVVRGLVTATAGQNVYLVQTGDMWLRNVYAGGTVRLEATTSIFDAVDIADVTNPYSANLAVTSSNAGTDITGVDISLVAIQTLGFIGAAGNEIDINMLGSVGVLNTVSYDSTYLNANTGDIRLNQVGTSAGYTAFITALSGSILNAALQGVTNITGGRAYLVAQKDIGLRDKNIYTTIGALQGRSTTGNTYLFNDGALAVSAFTGVGVGMYAGGDAIVQAHSPITVSSDVVVIGDLSYIANESATDDRDNITINAGISISASGTATFLAGDNFVLSAGASIQTGQNLVIVTDYGSLDSQGGDVTLTGTLHSTGYTHISTSATKSSSVVIDGLLTAQGDFVLTTGVVGDSVAINSTVQGAGVALLLGAGNDTLTLTGRLAATSGDTVLDLGSDADALDNVSISGALAAARDLLIYKMPAATWTAVVGVAQTVTVGVNALVRVQDGTRVTLYRYVPLGSAAINLGTANYADTSVWSATNTNTSGLGRAVLAMTAASSLTAGRDLVIRTGGGSDSLIDLGAITATTGDIFIDLANGVTGTAQVLQLGAKGVTAGGSLSVLADGATAVSLALTGQFTVGGEALFVTGSGADTISSSAVQTTGSWRLLANAGDDTVSVSGAITTTTGDLMLDLGTDADALNTLTVLAPLSAARDLIVLNLAQADHAATLGVSQSVTLALGDVVRVSTGSDARLYRALGTQTVQMDVGLTDYTDVLLWAQTDTNGRLHGIATLVISASGALTGGRNVHIQTGGGNDTLTAQAAISATLGDILIDLADSKLGGKQSVSLTTGLVVSGADTTIMSLGTAIAEFTFHGAIAAGGKLSLITGLGDDKITSTADLLGQSVLITTGVGSDQVSVIGKITATAGGALPVTKWTGTTGSTLLIVPLQGDLLTLTTNGVAGVYRYVGPANQMLDLATVAYWDSARWQSLIGDVTIDLGTDADAQNSLSVFGSITAAAAIRIYNLPQTEWSVISGVSQTATPSTGDLVSVMTQGEAAVYRYIGGRSRGLDLGFTSYSDTSLWQAVSEGSLGSGTTSISLSDAGTLTAGTNIDIWTGGGADTVSASGLWRAQGSLRLQTGMGADNIALNKGVIASMGNLAIDLGDGPLRATQSLKIANGGIAAGSDITLRASGIAKVSIAVSSDVVAGRDILIATDLGEDQITLGTLMTAGRNISVSTGAGSDSITVARSVTATSGALFIDLGTGETARQILQITRGSLISGAEMLVQASGTTAVLVDVNGGLVSGGAMTLRLADGADTIQIAGDLTAGAAMLIATGAGGDTVTLPGNLTSTGGSIRFDLGDGAAGGFSFMPSFDSLTVTGAIKAATSFTLTNTGSTGALIHLIGDVTAGSFILVSLASGADELTFDGKLKAGTALTVASSGGADIVTFNKMLEAVEGSVLVNLGTLASGTAIVALNDTVTAAQDISLISAGAGNLRLTLQKQATAGNAFLISTGNGADVITLNSGILAKAQAAVQSGGGSDRVTLPASGSITSTTGDVIIDLGAFDGALDTLVIAGSLTAAMALRLLDIGAGASAVTISATRLKSGKGGTTLSLSSGADVVLITGSTLETSGDMSILTDAGADLVILQEDVVTVSGALSLAAGAGDDVVKLLASKLSATTSTLNLGAGADYLLMQDLGKLGGKTVVLGGDGDDQIDILRLPTQASGDSLSIDGQNGADRVTVQTFGSGAGIGIGYDIRVFDSGLVSSGADALTVLGTAQDDVFLSRAGYVALLHATASQTLSNAAGRDSAIERISYDNSMDAGLLVSGLAGADLFVSDDTSAIAVFDGGDGADVFLIGQLYGSQPEVGGGFFSTVVDPIETVKTTRGYLSNGASYALLLRGGAGDDATLVYANAAALRLEGGAGNDRFTLAAMRISGLPEAASAYQAHGLIEVVGGSGIDTLSVMGTEAADAIVSAQDGIWGLGLNIKLSGTEDFIQIDGREGDDSIVVQSTAAGTLTNIIGDGGSDYVAIAGDVIQAVVSVASGGGFSFGSAPKFAATAAISTADWAAAASKTKTAAVGLLKDFDTGAHDLTAMLGALSVDGGRISTLSYRSASTLASESYATISALTSVYDEAASNDRIVLFSDATLTATLGAMSSVVSSDGRQRTLVSGLGMAEGKLDIGIGASDSLGVAISGFETTEVLLGQGNDRFDIAVSKTTADATALAGLTLIYGGAGADRLMVSAFADGAGLALFGDADTAGLRYSGTLLKASDTGRAFDATKGADKFGDTIDLSALAASGGLSSAIAVDGGVGADTIIGSAGRDLILGGSGSDNLSGGAGDDILIGDAGLSIDLATHLVSVIGSRLSSPITLAGDTRTPGADTISGDAGNDILAGDLVSLEALTGGLMLGRVWALGAVNSSDLGLGGGDMLSGGAGDDIVIGGMGSDTLYGAVSGLAANSGQDVLIGDYAGQWGRAFAGQDHLDRRQLWRS